MGSRPPDASFGAHSASTWAAAIHASPGAAPHEVHLRNHVIGNGGGAWLSLERPRLLFATARTLLVMTRFGPRLVPRFVLRKGHKQELSVVNDSFMMRSIRAGLPVERSTVPTRIAVTPEAATRVALTPEPECVECGKRVHDDRASCDMCIDPVHDGHCMERHANRHRGAPGGPLYR